MVVVQSDAFNQSKIGTVVCVAVTSNLSWADAPGNVLLPLAISGLDRDSVANVSQVITVDRSVLKRRTGHLPPRYIDLLVAGIAVVLGR